MVRLETFLESWKTVRQDTAQAVEDMPESELDFKPTPDLMSFRDIARHILDAGQGLTGMMLAGVDNFQSPTFRDDMKQHFSGLPSNASAAALAAELRRTADERTAQFAKLPADFFSAIMTRFDGQRVTRLEMLQFVKEHELTHRSQLFMYLRLKGIVPATTRQRMAKPAAEAAKRP